MLNMVTKLPDPVEPPILVTTEKRNEEIALTINGIAVAVITVGGRLYRWILNETDAAILRKLGFRIDHAKRIEYTGESL